MTGTAKYSHTQPLRLSQITHWDLETDVIVVGFGASGACAALEAASAGAAVTLFEAASGSGGTSALSGGEMYLGGGGGTPAQRAAGFADATEDLYQYLLMSGGPDADAAKVRLYADNSLAHFEWLVAQGVKYKNTYIPDKIVEPVTDDCLIWSGSEEAWPFNTVAKPCPRGHTPQWLGWGGGRYLMDVLAARAVAAGVQVQYDTRVLALIADGNNVVHGVVVKTAGQVRYARARRGVVMCAGGFVMNREMVKRHAPGALRSIDPIGTPGDDGSGIRMAISVGGAAIHMDQFFVTLPFYPPQSLVKGIFVNERGQRFINEDSYHGRTGSHILQQSGDRIFLLVDQNIYQEPEKYARIDIAAAAETWEEVESELQLPKGALVSTVEVFNRHAAQGSDPLFHKAAKWLHPLVTPPFVALDCRIGYSFYSSFTLGGIDTLPTGEVVDESRTPVPGLFAAGRTTCGLPRWGGGYSSGMSLADATFFGRQAGKRVAQAPLRAG